MNHQYYPSNSALESTSTTYGQCISWYQQLSTSSSNRNNPFVFDNYGILTRTYRGPQSSFTLSYHLSEVALSPHPTFQSPHGHSTSSVHLPTCPPSLLLSFTKVYFVLLAFSGSLRSTRSTSSGLIMTTRKFSLAILSSRSVTFWPNLWSVSGSFSAGVPGVGFRHVPIQF